MHRLMLQAVATTDRRHGDVVRRQDTAPVFDLRAASCQMAQSLGLIASSASKQP